jgi:acetylornithine deacetylase/succinyl-diaminopimelate desuccinylase-like protein
MPDSIDWSAAHAEALDLLTRYLRIDTSNPPGNEAPAARFLGALIEAEGVPTEYIETQPGREVLVARLPGDGSARPLMLCNHTDVVPVEGDFWTVPPFEGVVRDGRIYGRGAIDMKGAGVMQLLAFLLAKRQRLRLRRDIVFCAVPDEETGSRWGMEWLCAHRPDLVDVEFALCEGGTGISDFAGRPSRLFNVATTEKEMCPLILTVTGTPGHASRPHADNSAVRLAEAIVRLAHWDRGITFTTETRAYIEAVTEAGLLPSGAPAEVIPEALRDAPDLLAGFLNTLNVTVVHAGIKSNVVPARSEARIDCRLLPGESPEAWRQQVVAYLDDPRVEVTHATDEPAGQPGVASADTELFRVIEDVVRDAMEDALVLPAVSTVGTDNRFLTPRGVAAYGFIPALFSAEERAGFHAHDEFITVENLQLGCELTYEIVRRLSASPS